MYDDATVAKTFIFDCLFLFCRLRHRLCQFQMTTGQKKKASDFRTAQQTCLKRKLYKQLSDDEYQQSVKIFF
jgi:hypothetical protein